MIVAALLVGLGDELVVRARHRRSLRMTRREVQRERREPEGDPIQRSGRRERQRLHGELSASRALDDVRRADLVVIGSRGAGHRARLPARRAVRAGRVGQRGRLRRRAGIEQLARAAGVSVFLLRDAGLARAAGRRRGG